MFLVVGLFLTSSHWLRLWLTGIQHQHSSALSEDQHTFTRTWRPTDVMHPCTLFMPLQGLWGP